MALDGIMLSAIKSDLKQEIIGARIEKVYQIENKLLVFNLRQTGKNLNLAVSIDSQDARMHLTKLNYDFPPYPPDFCMLLRKHLKDTYIKEIIQPDFERIIEIIIEKRNNKFKLISELMGKYSNIILVDDKGIVLDSLKRIGKKISRKRQLYPGIKYEYPPGQNKFNPIKVRSKTDIFSAVKKDLEQSAFKSIMYNFRGIGPYSAKEIAYQAEVDYNKSYQNLNKAEKNALADEFLSLTENIKNKNFKPTLGIKENFEIDYISAFPLEHRQAAEHKTFENTGEMLDYYYRFFIKEKELNKLKKQLSQITGSFLNNNKEKQKKLYKKLKESKNAEKYKKIGEIITANIYQLEKGMEKAVLTDFYSEKQNNINIDLDPSLTPSENAQKYFKKYNKLKKSVNYIKKEIAKLRHEEKYLDQVSLNIKQAEKKEELEEIKEELKSEGYIKEKNSSRRKINSRPDKSSPRKFFSSDGYTILVGRNNRQNDNLTKKIANPGDIWLHTKTIAGSHVIIKRDTDKDVPERTLNEAAVLAAYYSKARQSKNVPVDFTEVQNVNKPKGARPGLVYYDDYKTIYTDPDEKLVERLAAD
ncbi:MULTISPECIES: NFACT family protein [unclassified Halanaerobium]|uniref:Rqc2 family fibronectin-binding protein n=1 Tax=unclassified Halanaerobium TaxID=2641197 RepID=UPI000DF42A53|nr:MULTISPECIES: NFACT RNA binding domain-containing protein [unclassified Halanaerobium]RCW51399.1 putative ribosome quality control (RQC) complex YloA/Tae2 family protein [Halanaerobium sp. MA284_MarDTE_T2]RCW79062.1 putative ribosome quality control (RQC) complex YloA/Tae2 family protein [Halanaerobium sp. DL-01]